MLSATLYRFRKDLAKKPWVIAIAVFAIGFMAMLLWTASVNTDDSIIRNTDLAIGSLNVILIVMFDFIFFSGLDNGVVGFTNADVNFHLAGPFSEKFNLLIAATGIAKLCAITLWVLCSQSSVLHMALGLNSFDIIALLLSAVVVMSVGYLLGAFLGACFNNDEKKLKTVKTIAIILNVAFVAVSFATLYKSCGSFEAIKALGLKGIIAGVGTTLWAKIFPVAGWVNLIYSGILTGNMVYLALGIIITVAAIAGVVILYLKGDVDYYEAAIAGAQKVADAKEAKKAGLDTDSTKLNRKIKVGKEVFDKGWGASAFFHRHLFENKRATRFFFINKLALIYRFITLAYIAIMSRTGFDYDGGPDMTMIMSVVMMIALNAVVFGGGKTVLEFNKPYIFMIPEKGTTKLFNCILSELPEMIFDSIVCGAIMWFCLKCSILACAGAAVMMLVFDILFELMAIISIRIFRSLGRVLLVMLRTFMGYGVVMVAIIPAAIVFFLSKSLFVFFISAAGAGAVIALILLLIAKNAVDNVEMAG